jgi:hypothetical protein
MSKKVLLPIAFPWLLAELLQYEPSLSYLAAWLGSFFIFYLTIISGTRYTPVDLPFTRQIMRPIILMQLVFAGFMCCTSIFYFIDQLYHSYFKEGFDTDLKLIAYCQRLALLGHTALVYGIIWRMNRQTPINYRLSVPLVPLLIKLCLASYGISIILEKFTALIQFRYNLMAVSIACATLTLVMGMVQKKLLSVLFGIIVLMANILTASLTGFKETIIIQLVLLLCLLFPYYKKTVALAAIPCLYVCLYVLPTFTLIIRQQSWAGLRNKEDARTLAFQTFFEEDSENQILENNWQFLTTRLSEIKMFGRFVNQTPRAQPYNWEIIQNALYALIPRAFWPEKPNTEAVAMERVYTYHVVQRASAASAKTRPIVDAYLTGGSLAIWISLFAYGFISQQLCETAERLFAGYQFGCVIIFNGIFQQLWRGNTFEFLLNNILYGYILMHLIFLCLSICKILIPVNNENPAHHTRL